VSCSWDVAFASYDGDIASPLVNKDQLIGIGAGIQIEEIVQGKHTASILDFLALLKYPRERRVSFVAVPMVRPPRVQVH
jgi:hypothetical protein